jgi:Tol biopolymer transport system component
VWSADGKQILVQSFADPTHPAIVEAVTLPKAASVRFISRTEIGYAINNLPDSPSAGVTEIWRMSFADKRPVSVAKVKGAVVDFAWSPDGSNLAYLVRTETPGDGDRFWLKVGAAAARALTPVITVYGREYIGTDEMIVRFSQDGKYLVIVDTVAAPRYFQVRSVPDGKLAFNPPEPSTGPLTMAAWSHFSNRIYYASSGVRSWDAVTKVVKVVVAGLNWSSPSVSPDDRLVAYSASGRDGKPHLEVRNLESGSVRILPGVRGMPILLSDNLMIEGHFLANVNGAPGPAYYLGRFYSLNLVTNVETALSGPPMDVWTR